MVPLVGRDRWRQIVPTAIQHPTCCLTSLFAIRLLTGRVEMVHYWTEADVVVSL